MIDKIIFKLDETIVYVKGKSFKIDYRPRILDLSEEDRKYLESIDTDRAKIILMASQTNSRDKIAEELGVSQGLVDYVITKWKAGRKTVVNRNGLLQKKSKAFEIVKKFVEEHKIDINEISGRSLTKLINQKLGLNLSEHSVRSSLYALGKKKKRKF